MLHTVAFPNGNPNHALVQRQRAVLSWVLLGDSSVQWSVGKYCYHKIQYTTGDQLAASVEMITRIEYLLENKLLSSLQERAARH